MLVISTQDTALRQLLCLILNPDSCALSPSIISEFSGKAKKEEKQ